MAPPTNGAATASLVLGIVSLVASLLFLPAILGVIFGVVGLNKAGQTNPPIGKGKAITGIVLSAIGLLLGIGLINLFTSGSDDVSEPAQNAVVQEDSAKDKGGSGAEEEADQPEADQAEAEPKEEAASIGDPVRDGKFEFTVTKVESGVESVGDDFFGETAQGQFVLVHMTIENIGNESQYFDSSNVTGFDADGREFSSATDAEIFLDDSNSFLNEINPGNSVEGIVIFDIPADTELTRLTLHDSMFSFGVDVTL